MEGEPKWKKIVVWCICGIAVLTIFIIVGTHLFKKDIQSKDSKVKPVITRTVKNVVKEASDSLYKLEFSNFNLSIDSGYADISNFKMSVDSGIYRKLETERKIPNNILTAKADKIVIDNVRFEKLQGEQTLRIGRM